MDRTGIAGKLQNRYNEQRGLKQNQAGGPSKPQKSTGPATPTHGNVAAMEKQEAATQVADQMVDGVTTGDMPGYTGQANTKKSRNKSDPNQQSLF